MAWYDDKKKTTHVAIYKDAETAEREQHEAAAKGWVVREETAAPERIAVGRARGPTSNGTERATGFHRMTLDDQPHPSIPGRNEARRPDEVRRAVTATGAPG